MSKRKAINIAKNMTNVAIKNSEIAKPYIKESHYVRTMIALNAIHWALKFADKE